MPCWFESKGHGISLFPFPTAPYRSILLNNLCVRAMEHTPDLFNFIEKMTVSVLHSLMMRSAAVIVIWVLLFKENFPGIGQEFILLLNMTIAPPLVGLGFGGEHSSNHVFVIIFQEIYFIDIICMYTNINRFRSVGF